MSKKKDQKASLCRPRFTEEGGEHKLIREGSGSKSNCEGSTKGEQLERLQKMEIIPGTATIGMMEEFREFP